MIASTAPILAAPNLQAQANQAPQRHDHPTVAVADPHRSPTLRTGRPERNQDLLACRLHTAPTPGHLKPPCSTPPETLNRQPVLLFLFFWAAFRVLPLDHDRGTNRSRDETCRPLLRPNVVFSI